MSVEMIQGGLLTTVQDAGRTGFRSLGIHPTGAMDLLSLNMANALVGNPDTTAVLELHFPCGQFLFHTDAGFTITGADFDAHVNDRPIHRNRLQRAFKGSVLRFARPVSGARAYLAVAGGFAMDAWLGSCSTDLSARAGGWKGRALIKGDRLSFVRSMQLNPAVSATPDIHVDPILPSGPLHLVAGPEWAHLSPAQQEVFLNQSWGITPRSDRMGIRMRGAEPISVDAGSMTSAAVAFGTVQCLPGGEWIVLMADHPVTGGYPRIAYLPYFEWSRLAQAVPGDSFNVRLMDPFEARQRDHHWERTHRALGETIRTAAQSYLRQYALDC